jgi:hypothetical protein
VNVYRNGILVSSVPSSAASALKVADNPAGENSYQVVVVEKSGKVSVSEKSTVVTKSNAVAPKKSTKQPIATKGKNSK